MYTFMDGYIRGVGEGASQKKSSSGHSDQKKDRSQNLVTLTLHGLEELFFQLCCCVSFWFGQEIGFGFAYLRTLLNKFFRTNIFLIVVEVLRYFMHQFR